MGNFTAAINLETIREIESLDSNADCMRWLAQDLQCAGITPFVGAGMSIPFGFPGWAPFLRSCAGLFGAAQAVEDFITSGRLEEAADACLQARNPQAFQDRLSASFGLDQHEVGFEHAARLIPALARGPVITTNFDRVLERLFAIANTPFEERVWGGRISAAMSGFQRNARILLKLHGDVDDSRDRVLTHEEYLQAYGSNENQLDEDKPLVKLLNLTACRKPFLFLGCSLQQDRTMAVLRNLYNKYPQVIHYAILEAPENPEELQKRAKFLGEHGIQRPIWFPTGRYDMIEVILLEILRRAGIPVQKPAARCLALVVGVSRSLQPGFQPRADAAASCDLIGDALENAGLAKFQVQRLQDPPKRDMETEVVRLFQQSSQHDTLVFYYIGKAHIGNNGAIFLCASDTEEPYQAKALQLSWLRKQIDAAAAAHVLVILDCPFIGSAEGDVSESLSGQIGQGHGKWVMTSTSRVITVDCADSATSGFSSLVAQGIRGLAADLNGDGIVTAEELFGFVERKLSGLDRPQSWTFDTNPGDIILSRTADAPLKPAPVIVANPDFVTTIRPLLKAKMIIPFIGHGIYGAGPLSSFALSSALVARAGLKTDEPIPLATAAQYLEHLRDDERSLVLQEFQELLENASRATGPVSTHDLLCELEPPMLIISTTHDWVLEQRLISENKPFVLVAHVLSSRDKEQDGNIIVYRPDTDPHVAFVPADKVSLNWEKDRIIYKVMGSPYLSNCADPNLQIDTTVLTETDHLTFLGALENQSTKMPDALNPCFLRRKLLFLGYSLDVWQYRLVMSLIRKLKVKTTFAVRQTRSPIEKLCWRCLRADLIEGDPESFVRGFRTGARTAASP